MSCRDLTAGQGTQIVAPEMVTRRYAPLSMREENIEQKWVQYFAVICNIDPFQSSADAKHEHIIKTVTGISLMQITFEMLFRYCPQFSPKYSQ